MKAKIEKIIEYGFYLFIFLLPWQTRWIWHEGFLNGGYWEYGSFSLYGTDILLIFLLILRLFIKKEKAGATKNIFILILALLFISFISIFNAVNQELSWYAFIKLVEGVLLFWLVLQMRFNFIKAGVAWVVPAFIQSSFAIYQFFTQSSPAFKWLGLASQTPEVLGTFVIGTSSGRFLRAYGSLPHPNMLAGFLVMALIILIGLYFVLYQNRNTKLFLLKNTLLIVFFIVITFGLLLTFSRSAWLALAISLIFLYIFNFIKKRKQSIWLLTKLTIAIILVAIMTVIMIPEPFSTRISGQQRLELKSSQERAAYYSEARQLLVKSWIKGVGMGNYTQAIHNQIDASRESWEYQPVHNIYLLIASEISVFGLFVFLILIFEILKSIYYHKSLLTDHVWLLVYSSIFLVILIIGLFDHYFWSLHFGILLFWLVLGWQVKSITEI